MDRLDAPVPPMISDALGYTHDAEWIAVYWESAGDEARYDDGRFSAECDQHA